MQGNAFADLAWLDANANILLTKSKGKASSVKRVALADEEVTVKSFDEVRAADLEAKETLDKAVDQLVEPFSFYKQADEAQALHRLQEAAGLFCKARDLLAALAAKCESRHGSAGLLLSAEDLRPYLEVFDKEASKTPAERTLAVVTGNLEYYVCPLLQLYYERNKAFPPSIEAFRQEALEPGWHINNIASTETDKAVRLFVVPGGRPRQGRILLRGRAAGRPPAAGIHPALTGPSRWQARPGHLSPQRKRPGRSYAGPRRLIPPLKRHRGDSRRRMILRPGILASMRRMILRRPTNIASPRVASSVLRTPVPSSPAPHKRIGGGGTTNSRVCPASNGHRVTGPLACQSSRRS